MRLFLIALLTLLTACAGHDLAAPSGKVFAFNPGQWTPAPADLAVPERLRQ